MRKLLMYLLLAMPGLQAFGQSTSDHVDVMWGDMARESRKSMVTGIVGYDETGVYVIKRKGLGIKGRRFALYLAHYDNKMNPTRSLLIEKVHLASQMTFEFVIQLKDKLYLFTSEKIQSKKKNILYVQSIDKARMIINGDRKVVAEIDYTGSGRRNTGGFSYRISRGKTKALLYYSMPYEKREKESFGFHVFDENMNRMWEKEVELPYTDNLFSVEEHNIDDKGNVYILGVAFNEKRRHKRDGKPNYKYHILSYQNKGADFKEHIVDLPGRFLVDMEVAITDDEDLICAGYYSEEGSFSIIGTYYLRVDGKTKKVEKTSYKEFGLDFITQDMTARQEKKTRKRAEKGKVVELYEYDLDDIVINEDGSAVLIGEQYYTDVVTYTTQGANGAMMTNTMYYYYRNDIIIVSFSPEGEIKWLDKIPKTQVTVNDGGLYSSYAKT
ncbi:MAG: hypothetical protein OEX02_15495, partial [Cyclobacteriaceae bacterium]|nr:hypothetical protein [Cyclobacteriaceae bacterium]